jgi:hypothetical protein
LFWNRTISGYPVRDIIEKMKPQKAGEEPASISFPGRIGEVITVFYLQIRFYSGHFDLTIHPEAPSRGAEGGKE